MARGLEHGPGGIEPERIHAMTELMTRIRSQLDEHIRPLLERWFARVIKKSDVAGGCAISAHLIFLFKNQERMDTTAVSSILSSQACPAPRVGCGWAGRGWVGRSWAGCGSECGWAGLDFDSAS